MKTLSKKSVLLFLLLISLSLSFSSCYPEEEEAQQEPSEACDEGIHYILDGTLVSFPDNTVTAEIHNDAAIGKFYDIWTDHDGGFYFHSTITETGESGPFAYEWFTTDDVANITFLNSEENVYITFKIQQGANEVHDNVRITFSGTYEANGSIHEITDGVICTTIDAVVP